MFSRLLALVGLLLLTQASFAQLSAQQSQTPTSDVPETCSVTKASDHPFIPPWPYAKVPYPGGPGSAPIGYGYLPRKMEHGGDWRNRPGGGPPRGRSWCNRLFSSTIEGGSPKTAVKFTLGRR
jgi:hypothetical protein